MDTIHEQRSIHEKQLFGLDSRKFRRARRQTQLLGRCGRARHEGERLRTGECERYRGNGEETVGIASPPQESEGELKLHIQEEH